MPWSRLQWMNSQHQTAMCSACAHLQPQTNKAQIARLARCQHDLTEDTSRLKLQVAVAHLSVKYLKVYMHGLYARSTAGLVLGLYASTCSIGMGRFTSMMRWQVLRKAFAVHGRRRRRAEGVHVSVKEHTLERAARETQTETSKRTQTVLKWGLDHHGKHE